MPSFGESMKRERELRQITLREISEATKINLRYLDALERNDFRHLPGGVFNKGFVRAFAQYIGIDPESMVTAYLQEEQSQQVRVEERRKEAQRRSLGGEAAPEHEERAGAEPAERRSRAVRIASAAMVVVGLAAVALLFVFLKPRAGQPSLPPPEPAAAPAPAPASPGPEEGLAARVIVVRSTPGTLNCDDRERRDLGGLLPGAELVLHCGSFLVVDAEDGGAIRLGIGGASPETLGPDGQPVRGHRIDAAHELPVRGKP